jgi:hypothetical protein
MDSKRTNERSPFLFSPLCFFMFCLGCSVLRSAPVQNIFFLTIHYLYSLSPSPSKLGRQPCWVACLLVCVSGRSPSPLLGETKRCRLPGLTNRYTAKKEKKVNDFPVPSRDVTYQTLPGFQVQGEFGK